MSTISSIAYGQQVPNTWFNAVKADVEAIEARRAETKTSLAYSPGGNLDTTTGTGPAFVTWMTLGNVTVPAWATLAYIALDVSGAFEFTASGNIQNVRPTLGGTAGRQRIMRLGVGAVSQRDINFALHDAIAVTPGVRSLTIETYRSGGAGVWRADTATDVVALVDFL